MREIPREMKLEVAEYYLLGCPYSEIENVTGISHGIETEVVSGLAEGDSIVIESRTSSGTGGLFGGSS